MKMMSYFPSQTEDASSGARRCMPFYRSSAACPLDSGGRQDVGRAVQRQQTNAITSFIDASLVYGHTAELESSLRDLSGLSGKLATNGRFQDGGGRAYLPSVAAVPSACRQEPQSERVECFSAGDSRVSEGLPLAALHTLWLREHNRVAEVLKCINPHWNPETIYQESRKVVGALHQVGDRWSGFAFPPFFFLYPTLVLSTDWLLHVVCFMVQHV